MVRRVGEHAPFVGGDDDDGLLLKTQFESEALHRAKKRLGAEVESLQSRLDSAVSMLRRFVDADEDDMPFARMEAEAWLKPAVVEKSRVVSMKAGREPDSPKGCTVADPQAYSDDKSRQPSPFVVEKLRENS